MLFSPKYQHVLQMLFLTSLSTLLLLRYFLFQRFYEEFLNLERQLVLFYDLQGHFVAKAQDAKHTLNCKTLNAREKNVSSLPVFHCGQNIWWKAVFNDVAGNYMF